MTPRPPQSSPFPQEQDTPRSNPWGGGPVASPPADAAPQPIAPPADNGVLNLQCPQCGGGLKLRREYVGVEGACVQCGTAIKAVAFANGQFGIELIQAESARFSSEEAEPPPAVVEAEAIPVQLQPSVEPPAPVSQEPQPSSLWQSASETPVEPEQPVAVTSAFGTSDSVPPQPQAEMPSMPSPPEEVTPNAWGQGEPGPSAEPPPQEPVPSFFNQEAATPAAPPLQPETGSPQQVNQFAPEQQAPAPQQVNQFAPEQQAPAPPVPPFPQPPAEQAFPSAAAAAAAAGGACANAAPPEPPGEESFQNFKAASPFDNEAEVEPQEMPQPAGQPQVTVAAGKNNQLGRSKRRGNYGFLKTIAVALVLGGLVFAAIVFVPKEKLDQGKKWALEFVKPVLEALNSRRDDPTGQPVEISNPSVDSGAPAPQPVTVSEATPAQAAVPASEPSGANVVPDTQPANAASQSLRVNLEGGAAIREFYDTPEIKDRVGLVLNPGKVASDMEAFYSETPELPGLVSVKFQKAVRSNDSGRWFGIFEVDESDDDKIHRWVAVEDEAGEFKLDWAMYEQTVSNGLQRFLDDPTAGTREFRVSVVRGDVVPEQNNPWNSEAIGLYIKSPFDRQAARPIILKATDFQDLGFSQNLVGTDPKLAQLELSWVPSEYNPDSSVPVVTKLIGWGAW